MVAPAGKIPRIKLTKAQTKPALPQLTPALLLPVPTQNLQEAEVQEVVPRLSARSSGDQVKELGDI
ncbi:hypothetical protein F441_17290 [Phytophthora nicotianae CJ01A1]|uniref:Uncharacterized protein n=5 Tax=Phytophthora nicotianae TaxID=4792 RepID=V9EC41_PHYNI|nr:hypothetical protein F443_17422 [Phytophthora nicotianae P1569]ETL30139.1 hypothetical protein L916_16846 [Phytophthora nicotianae]ETO65197.1 hypothetical protein F444_17459 [Phytophthora nicotianae P1976]ETP06299.1 hypothetical protein F441_17290 [Phytophthora nicotianae CJ01A1]ETP34412.1 hypothetical protein F442_17273 [Phytophthora nicotianae P10297]